MGEGAEQVLEGARRRLAVGGLGGGRAGRELPTSCTGRPRTPWSTSMVPQAIRFTSIHPALHVCTFFFQIGSEEQSGYGSGAASDEAGSQYEGSGTKSGFPNYAERCGQGCQGEPVQEVGGQEIKRHKIVSLKTRRFVAM